MTNIVNDNNFEIDENEINIYINYLREKLKDNREFSLVFIDKEKMQEYNLEFRNKDYPTDVLTFCEEDDYLGDILINYDIIDTQAKEYNHSFKRELYFLITHGYLHLHGYDHQTSEEEKEMFNLQEKLLSSYNIRRDDE